MDRNELLRRQQMQRSRKGGGIPGWLWGVLVGAIGAFVVAGIVMRPTPPPTPAAEPTVPASPTPPNMQPAPVQPAPASPSPTAEVAIRPPQSPVSGEQATQQQEEIERLRQEVEDLQRQSPRESAPAPSRAETPPAEEKAPESRPNVLEEMAQIEAEWRPDFNDFQKRYSEKKAELDDLLGKLKQMEAQCNYTQMGEPTEAQKKRGVRQEGLPASLIMGLPVGYGSSCETVDKDIKRAEQERYEALRQIQDECYQEAIARGVSTAKAKLR